MSISIEENTSEILIPIFKPSKKEVELVQAPIIQEQEPDEITSIIESIKSKL